MKTKRGSYYYIRYGDKFYAGMAPVMVAKSYSTIDAAALKEKLKKLPTYQVGKNPSKTYYWRGVMPGNVDKRYKSSLAVNPDMPLKVESELVPTDNYIHSWTDDQSKAKQFRIKSKADAKIQEIVKAMGVESVVPKLEFVGDPNERFAKRS